MFLGHSRCCLTPWTPHDSKVVRLAGAGLQWNGPSTYFTPPHSSPSLSRRAPQHGRIDAEDEPSPRHGAHGPRPTGNCFCLSVLLSIRLPCHLCAPAFSPFSTSVVSHIARLLGGEWIGQDCVQVDRVAVPGRRDALTCGLGTLQAEGLHVGAL